MSSDLVTALMQQSSFRSHRILKLQEENEKLRQSNNTLIAALQDVLYKHSNDVVRPKAFYIAVNALTAAGENHEQI